MPRDQEHLDGFVKLWLPARLPGIQGVVLKKHLSNGSDG
jgi:hypothetical protein